MEDGLSPRCSTRATGALEMLSGHHHGAADRGHSGAGGQVRAVHQSRLGTLGGSTRSRRPTRTIAGTIEILDRIRPLKCPDFFFDPFGDKGPLTADEAKCQNRGLDRIGREGARPGHEALRAQPRGPHALRRQGVAGGAARHRSGAGVDVPRSGLELAGGNRPFPAAFRSRRQGPPGRDPHAHAAQQAHRSDHGGRGATWTSTRPRRI